MDAPLPGRAKSLGKAAESGVLEIALSMFIFGVFMFGRMILKSDRDRMCSYKDSKLFSLTQVNLNQ